MAAYADRSDLDDFGGLPDGALSNEGRLASIVNPTSDTIELSNHGLVTDEEVAVRAIEGGTMPAPLLDGASYYAIRITDHVFKLAASPLGAAIDITTAGSGLVITKPLPIDRMLELYSRWVDDLLPAHLVPLQPSPLTGKYPIVIARLVAQLAGKALLNREGKASEVVDAAEIAAMAQVKRYAEGLPLRDPIATASANLSVSSVVGTAPDPRGWGSGYLP